jgi:Fe-S-cluster-containing dehydrogenase component
VSGKKGEWQLTSLKETYNDNIRLIIDLDRCWGCKACEVACKKEMSLDAGPRPMLVEEIGPRKINGILQRDFVPVMCQHCYEPACREVCPTQAIFRAEDKTIQIDSDLCTYCGECASACPFGAIDFSEQYGPVKCSLCFSRRKNGWLPSCAQHCEGRAFTLAIDNEDTSDLIPKKHTWSTGRIVYASNKWTSLGNALKT